MLLCELKLGLALVGLEPELVCSVVAVNVITEGAIQVVDSTTPAARAFNRVFSARIPETVKHPG